MKDAKLGDFLLWEGQPAVIIGETSGRQVVIEMITPDICQHCGGDIGKERFSVIVDSPLFQQNAKPISTIKEK